jgi:hypothetical protein
MPTLSIRSAPFPSRIPSRPIRIRPADSRPARHAGHYKGALAVAIIIVGLTAAGCGQYADPSAAASTPVSQQECVSAVYTVLSGMIAKPDDDQPFDDFVTHYGTTSATYAAYRDSYDPFYNEAITHGIKAAEEAVHGTVTRDCSTVN